ncbi:hypothetical protein KUCAC02_008144, partial [Chaenocephalus aceratus]
PVAQPASQLVQWSCLKSNTPILPERVVRSVLSNLVPRDMGNEVGSRKRGRAMHKERLLSTFLHAEQLSVTECFCGSFAGLYKPKLNSAVDK